MARCIVVHAGFHKTGTTTTQATLQHNGKHLWPTYAIVLPGRLSHVLRMATLHSSLRDQLTLDEFGHRLRAFLGTLDLGAKRGLVISAENISGLIPGRKDVTNYGCAPRLLVETAAAIEDTFGEVELKIVFTQREPSSWLRSTYWQNLRSVRLTEDWDTYAARMEGAVDLSETVAAVRDAVPQAQVRGTDIATTTATPLGSATPVIDAMVLSLATRGALQPVPSQNTAPQPEVIARVLDLNRSSLSDEDCRRAKAALLGALAP